MSFARIAAFKTELGGILRREIFHKPQNISTATQNALSSLDQGAAKADEVQNHEPSAYAESVGRTVLTLLGSTHPIPQAKQMFSSLQRPLLASPSRASQTSYDLLDEDVTTASNLPYYPAVRETALPNGIFTTKVVPTHISDKRSEKSKVVTLGELFAPPNTVAPLNPPRQSRHTATRSQSVNWYSQAESTIPTRSRSRYHYSNEHLPTGQWLTYNIVTPPAQLASPEAKRKQRDRALSLSESKSSLPQEVVEAQEQALQQAKKAHQQAKDEALYKSVYSSFAPDHDDATAVVSEQVKNKFWWNRMLENRFSTFNDELFEVEGSENVEDVDEESQFKEAVETWVPAEMPSELKIPAVTLNEQQGLDRDVEEILREISELLETLNSYQRVRNLSLTTNARTSAGQNPQLAALSGNPSTPTPAEFDTYTILKTQLSLMIGMLPPYAVAKLNGEQMGALNISTKIQVEGRDCAGTLRDSEIGTKSEPNPLPVALSTSMRTATPNLVAPTRSTQYQPPVVTPTPRASYVPHATPRANAPSATYPSQQYSARPASSTNQYSSRPAYSTPQQSSNSNRPPYSGSQYNYQTPQATQASQGQYTNGNRQFSSQNGYSAYNQQYGASQQVTTPALAQGSQYQRPSQPGYQQRAQNSQGYNYGSMPNGRSASPQNPASSYNGQRHPSASATAHSQSQSQSQSQIQSQSQSQNQNQSAPRPHYNTQSSHISGVNTNAMQLNGTVGQHLNLSPEEQAQLMNRQKAQLAHHQLQMANGKPSSGTPQPPYGSSGGQMSNGTVIPQSNGVTTG